MQSLDPQSPPIVVHSAIHILKVWPNFFHALGTREKWFELRKNDRNYRVGDVLILREYVPESSTYTGQVLVRWVRAVWRVDTLPGLVGTPPNEYAILELALDERLQPPAELLASLPAADEVRADWIAHFAARWAAFAVEQLDGRALPIAVEPSVAEKKVEERMERERNAARDRHRTIGQAWPVLNKYADHIDGAVMAANDEQRSAIGRLTREVAMTFALFAAEHRRNMKLQKEAHDQVARSGEPRIRQLIELVESFCEGASVPLDASTRFRVIEVRGHGGRAVLWDSDLAYGRAWQFTAEYRRTAAVNIVNAANSSQRFVVGGRSRWEDERDASVGASEATDASPGGV